MTRRILLLFAILFAANIKAHAQSGPFQTVWTNLAVSPTVSAPLTNLGQAGHILTVTWGNAGGGSCGATVLSQIHFEVSADNVTWWPVGAVIPFGAVAGTVNITSTTGAFNYIRARAVFDVTACVVSAKYSGVFSPVDPVAINIGTMQRLTVSVAQTGDFIQIAGRTGYSIVVYYFQLWNSGGSNTVLLKDSASFTVMTLTTLTQGLGYTYNSRTSLHKFGRGNSFLTNNSAATNVDFYTRYQFEGPTPNVTE